MTNAVEIRDVFRIYPGPRGGVVALQGLSLDVREGEICVVLGPSGSGKTTLLRMLAGLERPSAGTVTVLGADLAGLGTRGLARYRSERLGYADQHYRRALAAELTARELVALQLALGGAPQRERLTRADGLLERVGLLERRGARPPELSGGELQRIAVCAALAHRPRLFLADEPTGELDAVTADALYRLIGDLARDAGATTVLVSHDPGSTTIADRIVRVRDGRVSEEAAVADGEEEAIVVGRGGWLRLSEELLRRTGIHGRASARLHEEGIVLSSVDRDAPTPTPPDEQDAGAPAEARAPVVAELRGVAKTYGRGGAAAAALAGVSARFRAGRLAVVTGASGSGKTTLLHLLAGLELPTEGDVTVLDAALGTLSRDALAAFRARHVGLVGQDPGLLPFLSVRENVELALAVRGSSGDARAALTAVGLAEEADRRVRDLSSGQRERAAVARAVAARPALLLADEPTASLDRANALAVGRLLLGLARETGAAVVCATHDPVLIEQADDRLDLERPPARHAPAVA
ncbi:MAG TPA: ATP-binding cassette domain-containing protein [Gaiellaceae bacterium]|nr:ATP-binding cassette domain-containing protein [Gaiellaceae bacterium]